MVPKSCSSSNHHVYILANKVESGRKAKCMLTLFLRNVSVNYHVAHMLMLHWPEPTRLSYTQLQGMLKSIVFVLDWHESDKNAIAMAEREFRHWGHQWSGSCEEFGCICCISFIWVAIEPTSSEPTTTLAR